MLWIFPFAPTLNLFQDGLNPDDSIGDKDCKSASLEVLTKSQSVPAACLKSMKSRFVVNFFCRKV